MTGPSLLEDFLMASPLLRRALKGVERAAATDATVLLLGEAGTGRTTLARAIHEASGRRGGPWASVEPGSVPMELFESELFGHAPGAFTGAVSASPGKIGRAQGGTLLLDHVEEFPLSAQPKLLRVIAERRYTPLGGPEKEADLRFLAIGLPDLPGRIQVGAFRADLFYRLAVVTFVLPPLRDRAEDILPLARWLLADLGRRFERPGLRLSDSAEAWLPYHSWPGNGRQLRNVLERELVLSDGDLLDPKPSGEGAPIPLQELEKAHILRTLGFTRGHQGKAAALLGISRKALWEKRRRFGLP